MNYDKYLHRNILCIDLKSFFASVECVERKLDPFTTPLVVCDPKRNGAITLAVTSYLKQKGIKSRGRVYELPKDINIIKVPPRMHLYQEKSLEVIQVYLKYISIDDLYIYSIDECFLDVTSYLKLYKLSDYNLAKKIIKDVYDTTHLTVTAGIVPNMLLAKVSMDIEAKHVPDNIAYWSYESIPDKLWKIKPLSKMWGIGHNLEKRLNNMGLYSIYDIAHESINKLQNKFGTIGIELWYHANGIDETLISNLNKEEVKDKSYSESQVLFKDYYGYNIPIILYETSLRLARRLRNNKKLTSLIGLCISYNSSIGYGFYHTMSINEKINDENKIYDYVIYLFNKYYKDNLPIRKIAITLGKLTDNNQVQLSLFESYEEREHKKDELYVIDDVKEKFGANAILPASSLLSYSTIKERNKKIGGHQA